MSEIHDLLERQASWQASLLHLPWAEKVRLAEALRELAVKWRKAAPVERG